MKELIKQGIEKRFKRFSEKEIRKPERCVNLNEIRFYIDGLAKMIKGLEQRHNYVPDLAYELLNRYNQRQNRLMFQDYKNGYFQYNGIREFY